MSGERPLELEHITARLHADFTSRLPAGNFGDATDRERNFLSRALAAFATHQLAPCDLDEAALAVVDSGGDFGIDAIHFAQQTETLRIVQSKFDNSGRGEPDLGSVSKFCNGVNALLRGDFTPFSQSTQISRRQPELEKALRASALQVRGILVYSGTATLSEDRRYLFDQLRRTFSLDSEYLSLSTYNLTSIHDWISGGDAPQTVDELEFSIERPGWVKTPYETLYDQISLSVLFELWQKHGKRLIAANLRGYKGSTEVNDKIWKTLEEEPEHLFYLNNGLTAYCARLEVNNVDRANHERKRVKAYEFSIVNGAQTLGTIASYSEKVGTVPEGFTSIKLISLRGCADDRAFATPITQTTNFQNQITQRDFVALEVEQAAIANGLALSGICYHYKDTKDSRTDKTNFTLQEATTALACLGQQSACDLLSCIVRDSSSLWSFEKVYPSDVEHPSRYARLFKTVRSARSIWRAVQTQRIVIQAVSGNEGDAPKEFLNNCIWLVLNLVFLQLRPEIGEPVDLDQNEVSEISNAAREYTKIIWTCCENQGFIKKADPSGVEIVKSFDSVFSNADDCRALRVAALSSLSFAKPST
jgi:AIPR protein